ncbi:hypothetical protein ACKWRH_03715 [Bradyrhizobium sp. Pa8]|uniref:hypothetical protein n=1 Tax=Bradyrhizobium sp. Pa8 TaxID=3386552 RepID=UPI00403F16D9
MSSTDAQTVMNETPITPPTVTLNQLIDEVPDGEIVIELYKGVRTMRDIEAANEYVKAQVIKAQSIVADIARLHAATFSSCDGLEAPQTEAITRKARHFLSTLVRVDRELANSLAATQQEVESERPGSFRAKEDLNRLVLAVHELGRLRVQAEEIAKALGSLGAGIHAAYASCRSTSVLPLFAERDAPAVGSPERRSQALSPKSAIKPASSRVLRLAR